MRGDLLALPDAEGLLARLDAYEECRPDDPQPHEYRRERRVVETANGPVEAWVYLYALSVTGHRVIASGDYLAER
ncbi:gamma-glutamylcyclotransferase [Sphingobium scionense]